jgi:hypothetical protein
MNNPAPWHAKMAAARSGASAPAEEEGEKFFPEVPRNPLKRLDSDERIQGNPRK